VATCRECNFWDIKNEEDHESVCMWKPILVVPFWMCDLDINMAKEVLGSKAATLDHEGEGCPCFKKRIE
jgi:bifunctional pyridoxal-dependent enzyme with beta-cystathionase and maltose regulon repressor activities